jgi:hypothetical protein
VRENTKRLGLHPREVENVYIWRRRLRVVGAAFAKLRGEPSFFVARDHDGQTSRPSRVPKPSSKPFHHRTVFEDDSGIDMLRPQSEESCSILLTSKRASVRRLAVKKEARAKPLG